MPADLGAVPGRSINRFFRSRYLILAAAVWHICITLTVFLVGGYRLLPNQIDPVGLAMTSDAADYQGDSILLVYVLKNGSVREWATWPTQLHVRLYSLPLALLFRWFGFSILTIEPLNLIYYLLILALVFKIGRTIFDYESGLVAAGIVAVWPSLLFHTTQLLREPLLILGVLVMIYCVVKCLSGDLPWYRGLLLTLPAVLAILTIRIVRMPVWQLLYVVIPVAIILLLIRSVGEKRVAIGAAVFAAAMTMALVIIPRFQRSFQNQEQLMIEGGVQDREWLQELPLVQQIEARRRAFELLVDEDGNVVKVTGGSNIDTNARFRTVGDLVRYLPRALVVGLFSPFPNMWWKAGRQVGRGGRLLSGSETLLTYVIECLALFGLWRGRRKLAVWFLFIFAGLGALSLGIAVNNIGALYRLRYPFWVLLVILGAGGAVGLLRQTFLQPLMKASLSTSAWEYRSADLPA
jgi:putative peptidoglycan lipid II flippase